MAEYHGHKTLIDGSHVPLTKDEADAIMQTVTEAEQKRAEDMPSARDALSELIRAEQRMKDLGWWKGGGLRVKRGDECAVAQTGSTGIWTGRLDADGKYLYCGDYVHKPQDCWMKPLTDLSDDERAWMQECDRHEAEAYAAMMDRLASADDGQPDEQQEWHDYDPDC